MTQDSFSSVVPPDPGLQGRAILVVEDEFFQAEDLARTLRAAGARLVGPFPSPRTAIEALEAGAAIDAAVLDINLRGRNVYEVADLLAKRGIPFLFVTGYDPDLLPAAHRGRPVCGKPFVTARLLALLTDLCGSAGPAGAHDGSGRANGRTGPESTRFPDRTGGD